MTFIYLLILFMSINNIISENSSSTIRHLILPQCQTSKNNFESIPLSNNQYYYYFDISSDPSLASSISFIPLLNLSYCKHPQTASYLSSGFSILRSSPRFSLIDTFENKHSSFISSANVVQSVTVNQSTTVKNRIFTKMSTIISSTNITSIITTTTTLTIQNENSPFNMALPIGCTFLGIILIIILYSIIKFCNRDEGTYKIEENNNLTPKSNINEQEHNGCIGKISPNYHRQKLITTNEHDINGSKEWYV